MSYKFRITNTFSGLVLGTFEAENADEALDAMARDAGYRDYQHAYMVGRLDAWELKIERVDGEEGVAEK